MCFMVSDDVCVREKWTKIDVVYKAFIFDPHSEVEEQLSSPVRDNHHWELGEEYYLSGKMCTRERLMGWGNQMRSKEGFYVYRDARQAQNNFSPSWGFVVAKCHVRPCDLLEVSTCGRVATYKRIYIDSLVNNPNANA